MWQQSTPLCEMLGYISCRFKIDGGGGSKFGRSEILNHFTETHRMHLNHREKFRLCWESILTDDLKKSPQENDKLTLCSLSNEDPSPLFIVVLKIDDKAEFFSFCCIQVWGPETKKYKAEFSFVRHLPSSETEVLPGGSRRCKKVVNHVHRYQIRYYQILLHFKLILNFQLI
ncbi:unnamed protein product [Orchesella dallaii]|uniref:Uncharacterized protein n=1 Tax=Orchesella dallaii TaxID=48710 RepID=A0ABP1RLJ7_9HEXA